MASSIAAATEAKKLAPNTLMMSLGVESEADCPHVKANFSPQLAAY
jgi:hypothetical protein